MKKGGGIRPYETLATSVKRIGAKSNPGENREKIS